MPRRLFTSGRILWTSVAVIVFYFIGYFMFGADNPRIIFTALLIGMLTAIHLGMFKPAIESIRRGLADGGDNFLVSLWGVNSLLLYYFLWVQASTVLRVRYEAGLPGGVDPEVLRSLPVSGAIVTLLFLVASFTVLAPLNEKVMIEKPSLTRWWWAVGIGFFVSGVIATLSFQKIITLF